MKHYSVLLEKSIELLDIKQNGIYVDGTLGRAGHSAAILKKIPNGHLYAFDKDQEAIDESVEKLKKIGSNFTLIHNGFEDLDKQLSIHGVETIDGLLLDIGVSSPQFDDAQRGFSYRSEAKLDMRMNKEQAFSAYELVNEYSYEQLVYVISRYGEEKFAKQIVRKIEKYRETKSIETTTELVEIIKSALPTKVLNKKGHPAKKTFQALRIEVNNELTALETVLEAGISRLALDGRICVITFHSLEDRIVKDIFKKYSRAEKTDKRIPLLPEQIQTKAYEEITRKPILADEEELSKNRRSHSAKLRVLRKVR